MAACIGRLYSAVAGAVALSLFVWAAFQFETLRLLITSVAPILGRGLLAAAVAATAAAVCWRRMARMRPSSAQGHRSARHLSRAAGATAPVLAAVAFLLPAFHSWTTAEPLWPGAGSLVLGILPWSDAGAYYVGAEGFLTEGVLDPWNQRRPLNAALFAVRLALVDHD